MPCSVCARVAELGSLLRLDQLPANYLLVGGQVEKQLKWLLAAAWQMSDPETRAYVMDKNFPRQLDLLALESCEPRFWMETKCTFRQDENQSQKVAYGALRQVSEILESIDPHLDAVPGYIVHFLSSTPEDQELLLPDWVLAKYNRLRGDIQPQIVEAIYTNAGHRAHGIFRLSEAPALDAIVIEIVQAPNQTLVDCSGAEARASDLSTMRAHHDSGADPIREPVPGAADKPGGSERQGPTITGRIQA